MVGIVARDYIVVAKRLQALGMLVLLSGFIVFVEISQVFVGFFGICRVLNTGGGSRPHHFGGGLDPKNNLKNALRPPCSLFMGLIFYLSDHFYLVLGHIWGEHELQKIHRLDS